MTNNQLTIQDLIDVLTDETQISVEDRSLPLVFSSSSAAVVTKLTQMALMRVGFNKAGYCVIVDRAKRPDNLEDIGSVICLCTNNRSYVMRTDPNTDSATDAANPQVDT